MFFDQLVNGLTLGSQYALVAGGLALIFSVVGIANFAQGEFYMVAAFMIYGLESAGLPYFACCVVTLVGMAVFGLVVYGVALRPVTGRGWETQLVATLAVSLLLTNLAIAALGSLPVLVRSPLLAHTVSIGPTDVSDQRLLVFAATAMALVVLGGMVKFSKIGKGMRAVSQNREAAVIMGIPVRRVEMTAVVIGCVFAGVAAVTIAPLGTVAPTVGAPLTIKAFAAVVMGGFGNISGPIVSGLVLGLVEAYAGGYISSAYADAFVFGVMIVILVVRPRGLFGRAVRAA
jgi:branched-chain amino acid transport system permease protein